MYKTRESVRENLNNFSEVERVLLETMNADELTQTEELMRKAYDDARAANIDQPIIKVANKVLTNVIIRTLQTKLAAGLENFELEVVQAALEQAENGDMVIDDELRTKAEEFLFQAESNPNWIAEKQAELKKATKGKPGKK